MADFKHADHLPNQGHDLDMLAYVHTAVRVPVGNPVRFHMRVDSAHIFGKERNKDAKKEALVNCRENEHRRHLKVSQPPTYTLN